MSGTMSDAEIKDLSEYEFTIPCEWPDCVEPAAVMGKGCVDERHVAVCAGHHEYIREWFDCIPPQIRCMACLAPMLVFEHHFDIVPL